MVKLATKLGSMTLKNPIMPASGTFSDDLAGVFDLDLLGAHVTKTITAQKRGGNPTPRVCEVRGSMLNSIGIPSKGVDHFVSEVVPFYARYDAPLVVSISADTADDFAALCQRVAVPGVAAIEANISLGSDRLGYQIGGCCRTFKTPLFNQAAEKCMNHAAI